MKDNIKILREDFLNCDRCVDTERVEIVTESFFTHIASPPIVQRALVLKDLLTKMTVVVREHEIFVGNQGGIKKRSVPLFPEYGYKWIRDQMHTFETRIGDRFKITEEQQEILRKCLEKWAGYSMDDRSYALTPEPLRAILRLGVIKNTNFNMSGPGHMSPDYERMLSRGFLSIIEECREKLADLNRTRVDYNYIEKTAFYEACIITCEAMITFAGRYADLAEEEAAREQDPERAEDLRKIAEVCRNVPAKPVHTYHEALQFVHFIQLVMQLESNGLSIAYGRLDQTLFPYYQNSRNEGMSREDALLLSEYFFLKCNEIDKIYSNEATRHQQGPAIGCMTLGGVDRNGKDCVNDLTILLLEADYRTSLAQPDIAVRLTKTAPEEFLAKIGEGVKKGINKIKVFGDEVVVEAMRSLGTEPGDAEDWCNFGCSEAVVSGKTNSWGNAGQINLAKCLELALNHGKCMLTGQQMGPRTGDMANAESFEVVLNAFRAQVDYFTDAIADYDAVLEYCQKNYYPVPLYSVVTQDCIRDGVEFNAGGARYNTASPLGVGLITAGDSLQAIKTLVFDQKRLTMAKLLEVLEADFEGNEPIRQMLLNRAPKFGNDSDEADGMNNQVLHIYMDALGRQKCNRGNGPFIGGLYYVTSYIPFGLITAATPDGRRATRPLNDGGISPTHGMDRKGPTAVLKSVGKLDHVEILHGCVLNQKFHPSVFVGENSTDSFNSYMRGIAELDCWECQYNVLTTETLRKAQASPEKYKGLVVRVAGYSALFTRLEKEIQEEIIRRTAHSANA